MTIDVLIRGVSSYKDAVRNRPLSSPVSPNDRPGMISDEDRRQILSTRGSIDSNSRTSSRNDNGRVSFLTVPNTGASRRPSTADVVIERLQVEKLEGGGLTISGIVLAANCHISLIVFGLFFLLAGIVLSYVGFAVTENETNQDQSSEDVIPEAAGAPHGSLQDNQNHRQMQVIGPVMLILGISMLIIGMLLCGISSKISRDEKARRIAMSTAQLNQLESNFSQANNFPNSHTSPIHTSAPSQNQAYPILSLRRGSWWMEPTPIEFPPNAGEGAIQSSQVATFDGSRSSSPMLTNTPDLPEVASLVAPIPGQHSIKRMSSPHISLFYGDEASMDIATFPSEDFDLASTFPGRVPYYESAEKSRRESLKSDQKPQIFEVIEAKEDSCVNNNNVASDKLEPKAPNIPVITVSNATDTESPPAIHREIKESVVNYSPISSTTNLPLSKNGVALPRLSRHSVARSSELSRVSSQVEDR